MFLRRFQRRKDGKVHSYWALVESYRTARGSRQRTVSYLGELKPSEQSGWAQLDPQAEWSSAVAVFATVVVRSAALRQVGRRQARRTRAG